MKSKGDAEKIGLYTIFRCTNYGAVLQGYALASVLRKMFGDSRVEIINHLMDKRDNHLLGKISNPNTPWFQRWRNRRKANRRFFMPEAFEERRAKTIDIINNILRPTIRLYKSPDELSELPHYQTVIVGSDQIWNPILNFEFGRNQYLAVDLKKEQRRVAYAASFGIAELPEECKDIYRDAIGKFDVITCREESGVRLCNELLGCSPELVLDPTLLINASEWSRMISRTSQNKSGDIVAYWVRPVTQSDLDALVALADARNTRIRLLSAGPMPKISYPDSITPLVSADPFDFVAEIAASSMVITDGFHGLQFATIFRKPFLALGILDNPKSDASRLIDFGNRYGLSQGIGDIREFRALRSHGLASFDSFDEVTFKNDQIHSLSALEQMTVC